jgi:glutathione S-transferase
MRDIVLSLPMAMTLYVGSKHLSSWSLRPYLALTAAGAEFTDEVIALDQPATRAGILAVNPAGRVPVLHHDGLVIWDSLAICEYVAELFPAAQLWPADRALRARARAISAEMHSGFAALRRDMPVSIGSSLPRIGHTLDALADANRILAIWRECRTQVDSRGPFLFGGFTIADAMFAPVVTRFETYAVPVDEVAQAYMAAIAGAPGMRSWRSAAEHETH